MEIVRCALSRCIHSRSVMVNLAASNAKDFRRFDFLLGKKLESHAAASGRSCLAVKYVESVGFMLSNLPKTLDEPEEPKRAAYRMQTRSIGRNNTLRL